MKLVERWIAGLVHTFNLLTLSPTPNEDIGQQPLGQPSAAEIGSGPVFQPPNSGKEFICNYSLGQPYWKECSHPQNRGCWLRGPNGQEFNISTNYERIAPVGVVRKYELEVSEALPWLDPDGFKNTRGKVFNKQYPGPWIQACWGDTLEIKVTNKLPTNGTTIHWHGIRQNGTLDMDGVNGVTQCPIAEGDSFTYRFKATQYGTSWYHSHYSLQYGDGLLGPMTIYGPSSANYDEAKRPILMTDWSHRSAFEDFYLEMTGKKPFMTSSLMNGRGTYTCTDTETKAGNCTKPPNKYSITFEEGKKYLLRLINTSVDSTWIFSIDGHDIEVIGSDFVPIKPYRTNHVLVGIGQRYHVVVEATRPLIDSDYWIRMTVAKRCSGYNPKLGPPKEEIAILRYNASSQREPATKTNTFVNSCADEPYQSLVPILPWKVGKPSTEQEYNTFQVGISPKAPRAPWGNISRWEMGKNPLWLNFSNPTILNVNKSYDWDNNATLSDLVVVNEENADTADSWIYLLISAAKFPFGGSNRRFVPAFHPIHLHGHDFAILAQSKTPYWDGLVDMKFDNPPRRDVALLPGGGYLIIAFKADNPGSWLLHCHIAWHASSGLALQILEREKDIPGTLTPARKAETDRVCKRWDAWVKTHHFDQDDSGI